MDIDLPAGQAPQLQFQQQHQQHDDHQARTSQSASPSQGSNPPASSGQQASASAGGVSFRRLVDDLPLFPLAGGH